jgi:hypothetical protein
VEATVLFPVVRGADQILVNGTAHTGTATEDGTRIAIVLSSAGHYELRNR